MEDKHIHHHQLPDAERAPLSMLEESICLDDTVNMDTVPMETETMQDQPVIMHNVKIDIFKIGEYT